jgi:hypothetical protein
VKYAIGAIIGILIYHYYPSETRDLAAKAGTIVHEGAVKAAEITKQ